MLFLRNITRREIKLFWSHTNRNKGLINFGDALSPMIIERIFRKKVTYTPLEECDLVSVGSILERAERSSIDTKRGFNVWGSGFIEAGPKLRESRLNYSAVRGKLTEERVPEKVPALGDPGLLADRLLKKRQAKKYKFALVPHYVDKNNPAFLNFSEAFKSKVIVNVFDDPLTVIKTIDQAESVLSSSLHGLIIADSLGVPNIRLKISDKIIGGDYKYNDYYSVFNMKSHSSISIHDKNATKAENIEALINSYEQKDVAGIQEGLIKSFPQN